MANCTVKTSVGILCDFSVRVAYFIFHVDFSILKYEVEFEVPIIIGKSFIVT